MFKNLNHALRWTFEVLERDITGYSNTAAIMRLGEQCGASASTSPDDLTIQEQKAQAVWVHSIVELNTNGIENKIIFALNGFKQKENIYNLASILAKSNDDFNIVQDVLCNIFKVSGDCYKMKRIADRYEKHEPTIYRLRRKLEKEVDSWRFPAETKIENALIEKGLINRLT